jgi:hypothetical protein
MCADQFGELETASVSQRRVGVSATWSYALIGSFWHIRLFAT